MSEKEFAIKLVEHRPDESSPDQILATLRTACEKHLEPNKNRGDDWAAPELSEEEWAELVANGLRDELQDAREDIYLVVDGHAVVRPTGVKTSDCQ